jgi:hypothetical protein
MAAPVRTDLPVNNSVGFPTLTFFVKGYGKPAIGGEFEFNAL